MTINDVIKNATKQLSIAGVASSQLDAEIILSHVLGRDRSWLLAHHDDVMTNIQINDVEELVVRRSRREPLAYIVGAREFYGHNFAVNSNVLIPRPESEIIVEYVVASAPQNAQVLDVGTGSGALAVSIAQARKDLTILATDISHEALAIASKNADALGAQAQVNFEISDLLTNITTNLPFDIVTANLPYVTTDMLLQPELSFEPKLALFAQGDGLDIYRELFAQCAQSRLLTTRHEIICECDTSQLEALAMIAQEHGYTTKMISDFVLTAKK